MYVVAIYAVLTLATFALYYYPFPVISMAGMEWNWGRAFGFAIFFYTIASLKEVSSEEIGVRSMFGRTLHQIPEKDSGLVFVPLGIMTLKKVTRREVQDELPGDPEKIFRGTGNVPPGMFLPTKITFGPPNPSDGIPADDPYNVRMEAEVVVVITWEIDDYIKFHDSVGDVKQARRFMEDEAISTLNEECSKMTPAAAEKDFAGISEKVKKALQTRVEDWGIKLKGTRIKAILYDPALSAAVLAIPEAREKAKAAVLTAEGNKQVKILNGEGDGGAKKAILDLETAALQKRVKDLGLTGSVVLAAETAVNITNNPGQKTIIAGSQGFADLARIGSVLGETINHPKGA